MQKTRAGKASKKSRRGRAPEWGTHSPSYEGRLKAAGISPDEEPPEDIDAFRFALARRIAMFVNDWRGCPEPLCRRHRGCMAPNIRCANVADGPPPSEEESRRAIGKFYQAVQDEIGRRGAEEK